MAVAPLSAERALREQLNASHLGAMFTELVNALDMPSRRQLAEIVESCHTRKSSGGDMRGQPVLFFGEKDEVTQTLGVRHLEMGAVGGEGGGGMSDLPELSEGVLVGCMDEETRKQYLVARFYGCKKECAEVGYKYLLHLMRPDLPLDETIRELPAESEEEDGLSEEEESFCSAMSDVTHESSLSKDGTIGWSETSGEEVGREREWECGQYEDEMMTRW